MILWTINDSRNLIKSKGIHNIIQDVSLYILNSYKKWDTFQKIERIATYTIDGPLELMPISDSSFYAFKYVNCHNKNPIMFHTLSVVGVGMLSSCFSGIPLIFSEMTILTAIRTAVTSALVATYLKPSNAQTMALIGNGAQCEFQIMAFHKLCGIKTFHIYDIDKEASQKVKNNLSSMNIHIFDSISDAIKNVDIITTCTNAEGHCKIIEDEWLPEYVHINAIGGDRPGKTELDVNILKRADIFVEYEAQTRVEGEIQQLPDVNVTEIWKLFTEDYKRSSITVFDSVGFAIEDYSILRYVYDNSREQDSNIIPKINNPKNLYSLLS